ncbi:dipeptide epimerase [Tenacibaculum sp. A30]|uniref:dipeptide epimerase n=1 Tax=Tenacibaculum sp. A30 TaxID=3442644 RepID=UPI003EB86F65
MNILLKPFVLKLQHTFTISRESHNKQPTLIVCLEDEGITGYGEATSNPYYHSTVNILQKDILHCWEFIKHASVKHTTPENFWKLAHPYLKNNMFALCALDMAYTDLYARYKQQKLYEYWDETIDNNPLTNYTIGIDTIKKMVFKIQEKPWPLYKIKLGTKDDITIVTELRKHTDAIFRIDANCGWTANETIQNAIHLKTLGVEFIEQPLKADDWTSIKKVYENSVLPIIADESCIVEQDIKKCAGFYHGVNIKLVKCGGLTPARRMISEAKKLQLKVMVGCMTESSVGISAIAHLLPQLDYVDMDGALLLKEDIAKGVVIENGKIFYTNSYGTGVELL